MTTDEDIQGFTPRQAQTVLSTLRQQRRLNVWHGAVSSGKTIASIYAWLKDLYDGPPGPHLLAGRTNYTAIRNVCSIIQAWEPSATINRGTGEMHIYGRTVYIAGANDERSEEKIRGLTLAGAYCDEISVWPESFWRMLMSRLRLPGARLYGTSNPDSPYHWLWSNVLTNDALDLSVHHFRLTDNPTLDPSYIEALSHEYTGLWRRRYIDGEWVIAEGSIYSMWDPQQHVVDELPMIRRQWMGIDYGTSNPTAVVVLGEGVDGLWYLCAEWVWDPKQRGRQLTDAELSRRLAAWMKENEIFPERIYYDPSAASLGQQLYRDRFHSLTHADNTVLDGIRDCASLLDSGYFRVHRSCETFQREISSYSWDPKAQQRGEDAPLKRDDHTQDSFRYVCRGTRTYWRRLINQREDDRLAVA